MLPLKVFDAPTVAEAMDGEVVLRGPGGVAVSMTPDAAEETARRLARSAARARRQLAKVLKSPRRGAQGPA